MGIAIVHYYSPHTLKSKRIKRIEMIQFTGFPNGTDDAKSFRAADGSKTACDFEFDFHGTHLAFGGIVNDFGFRNVNLLPPFFNDSSSAWLGRIKVFMGLRIVDIGG
jgi:hypothetical protein